MIEFVCPHCMSTLRIPDQHIGKTGKCNRCGKTITIHVSTPPSPDLSSTTLPKIEDTKQKFEKSTTGAQPGDAEYQFKLGESFMRVDLIFEHANKAIEWLSKAARQGHAEAYFRLGEIFSNLELFQVTDFAKGFQCFQAAAELGYSKAQVLVGEAFRYGRDIDNLHVPEDHVKAFKWYSKAVDQDDPDPEALYALGVLYRIGAGIPLDDAKSDEFIRRAAEKGHEGAQNNQRRMLAIERFPSPEICATCGEEDFELTEVSPNVRSAVWKCSHCGRTERIRAGSGTEKPEGREPIPKKVQNEVWRRDQGKCVECGSNENLEYDHIIAVSRGGSNTVRNLQLLCMVCNRRKSDREPGNY